MSTKQKFLIYVAGPLTTGGERESVNLRRALHAAEQIADLGHRPLVPHTSLVWDQIHPHDHAWWVDLCLGWLERCDAVLLLSGASEGASAEARRAEELGLPLLRANSGNTQSVRAAVSGLETACTWKAAAVFGLETACTWKELKASATPPAPPTPAAPPINLRTLGKGNEDVEPKPLRDLAALSLALVRLEQRTEKRLSALERRAALAAPAEDRSLDVVVPPEGANAAWVPGPPPAEPSFGEVGVRP